MISGSVPRPGVPWAVGMIEAGRAETLDGRGANASYLVQDGDRRFSVKVHSPSHSSIVEERRIASVDVVLRGVRWYPPLLGLGRHGSRLVVIRPFAPGSPPDGPRGHLDAVIDVLSDLADRGRGAAVPADLTGDYASAWLSDWDGERRAVSRFLTGGWGHLADAMDAHGDALLQSAARLTDPEDVVVHHGDLHGRNLIVDGPSALTVIDWDEAGFAHRPSDAGKALWLSCRQERGDFALNPDAVHKFLHRAHASLSLPYADAVDLARVGALWFLPRHGHVSLLRQRDADMALWYLGWVSRFWSRIRGNLELVAGTAERLARGGSRSH